MVFPFVEDGRCHPTNEEYQEPFSCTVAALISFGCLFAGFWYQDVTNSPKHNRLSASIVAPSAFAAALDGFSTAGLLDSLRSARRLPRERFGALLIAGKSFV
jgi:hypothetical protein